MIRFLRHRGIKQLDTLLITTWKDQQLGGALDVLKSFRPRQFFHNAVFAAGPRANEVYAYAQQQERLKKMLMGSPGPGQSITIFYSPPCRLNAIAPTGPMIDRFQNDPDCSLVVEFSYDKLSVLELGETTRKHQEAMWKTSRDKPEGQVLVIGHAGTSDALLPSLLKPLKTRIAVIPVARRSGKAPSAQTLALLRKAKVKVYRTDLQGDLTVTTDGRSVNVKTGK